MLGRYLFLFFSALIFLNGVEVKANIFDRACCYVRNTSCSSEIEVFDKNNVSHGKLSEASSSKIKLSKHDFPITVKYWYYEYESDQMQWLPKTIDTPGCYTLEGGGSHGVPCGHLHATRWTCLF